MPEVFPVLRDEIKGTITIGTKLHCTSWSCEIHAQDFYLHPTGPSFCYRVAHELLMSRSDNAQHHAISTAFADQVSRSAERPKAV